MTTLELKMKDRVHRESVAVQGNTAGEEMQTRPVSFTGKMAAEGKQIRPPMYTPTFLGQHHRS